MKFGVQVCVVLFLIGIVAPTVLAQMLAEKESRASHVASLEVPNLLAPKTDSTGAGGLANPAANINPSANEELKPPAIASAQNSFRAGVASINAGHYQDALASLEAARRLAPNSSAVYAELGNAYLCLNDYENSI